VPEVDCGFRDGLDVYARELLIEVGPTLKVDIGFDPNFDVAQPRRVANLPMSDVWALIDTGASSCCIDSGLAMELRLPIIDQQDCAGISGLMQVNMHLAQIRSPHLNFTLHGAFAGVNLLAGGQRHAVLIGRTFLRHFDMRYDGPNGSVVLSDPL
jgi:hypothetical protein